MLPAGREAAMVLILVVSRPHDSSLRVVDESRTRMGYIAPTAGANVVLHFHAWGAPVHQTQHTPPPHTATTPPGLAEGATKDNRVLLCLSPETQLRPLEEYPA